MGWEGSSSQRQKGNIVTINGRDTAFQGAEEIIAWWRSEKGSGSLEELLQGYGVLQGHGVVTQSDNQTNQEIRKSDNQNNQTIRQICISAY